MAKSITFGAKMSQKSKDDCDKIKAEIKLIKLPTKITDGEIVEQGLKLYLKEVKYEKSNS